MVLKNINAIFNVRHVIYHVVLKNVSAIFKVRDLVYHVVLKNVSAIFNVRHLEYHGVFNRRSCYLRITYINPVSVSISSFSIVTCMTYDGLRVPGELSKWNQHHI